MRNRGQKGSGHRRRSSDGETAASSAPAGSASAPAVVSFLKEFSAAPPWTAKDLAGALNVAESEANAALPMLEAAGYVQRTSGGRWMTTDQADAVSGAKEPRFTRASVDKAVSGLIDRVRAWNAEQRRGTKVARMIVYGDYLSERERVQPAEIAIEFEHSGDRGAAEQAVENEAVKGLKARSAMLNTHLLEPWMAGRSHRVLL